MRILALFAIFCSGLIFAETQILIFRHGEKVSENKQDVYLSPLGALRAQALADWLSGTNSPIKYSSNITVFAKHNPNKPTSSQRPLLTAEPFAAKTIGISNIIKYTEKDAINKNELAKSIKKLNRVSGNKTVLIFWDHQNMPKVANAIKNTFSTSSNCNCTIPRYPGNVFDQYWEFKLSNGAITSFSSNNTQMQSGITWQPLTQAQVQAAIKVLNGFSLLATLKTQYYTPQITALNALALPMSNFWSTVHNLENNCCKLYLTIDNVTSNLGKKTCPTSAAIVGSCPATKSPATQ